jgi:hypothetical protein
MALDFLTEPVLSSAVTFSRASTATRVGQDGLIQTAAVDAPRFDFDPVTLAPRGLLIEEARTNLLLNSPINGVALPTQSVTVTAVPHTISFYGTGTIALSGVSVASVVGTGAYPNRQTLTFTPTAGVLVCTVVGLVQFAQLEVGSFATSFIPTAGTTAARSADIVTMTGANFSNWYNATEGTLVANFFASQAVSTLSGISAISDGTINNEMLIYYTNVSSINRVAVAGAVQASIVTNAVLANNAYRFGFAYKLNDFASSLSGGAVGTDTAGTVPTANRLTLGARASGVNALNGHIRTIAYYNRRLPNAMLQALTA